MTTPPPFGFNINLISSNLDDGNKLLASFGEKEEKSKKSSIFDYWNWNYNLNQSFDKQVEIIFQKLIFYKENFDNSFITNECLVIICNESEATIILNKFKEDIEDKDFMPLTLFLYKEKFNINFDDYEEIDPRIIYFEELSNIDNINEEINPIKKILLRFYSIYNELGDKIQIGTDGNLLDFNLIKNIFPFYLNIVCLGKFRQGKSTCVNCLLDQLRARETESGVSQTQKINSYVADEYPIKIYDMPGFQDEDSINAAVEKLKELNNEIKILKDRIHIILYIFNVNETAKFQKNEFSIFKELINHEESKIIYVFTHTNKSLFSDKKEKNKIINQTEKAKNKIINDGIKELRNKENKSEDEIKELEKKMKEKMLIDENNTVFVNFHKKKEEPELGINNLFKCINQFFRNTNSYKKRNDDLIKKADELKARALNELKSNRIKGALSGIFPVVDIIVQKTLIKPDSIEKASKIFGLDFNEIIKSEDELDKKVVRNVGIATGDAAGISGIYYGTQKVIETSVNYIYRTIPKIIDKTFWGFKYGEEIIETTIKSPQVTTKFVNVANSSLKVGFGIASLGITTLIGAGLGFFITNKESNLIVEKLYKKFLEIQPNCGKSYEKSVLYLSIMEKKYNNSH